MATARDRRRGLSLVEVTIALVVLVLLGAAAAPAWTGWLEQRRLLGVSHELVADLRYLQSEAVKRNADLRISFLPHPGGSCYLLHSGSASLCSCAGPGGARCLAPAEVLKATFRPASERLSLDASSPSMLYSARAGTFTPSGTIRVRSAGGLVLQHRVNLRGRIRSCAEGSPRLGLPAC